MVVEDKQVGPGVLHEVLAEMIDQKGDVGWLTAAVGAWQGDCVASLVVEEHLETSALRELPMSVDEM